QVFKRYVEIGRVAYISFGPHAGKLVAIVDVIDQNRALVDGPCSGVRRQAMPFKCMQLTDFVIKIQHRYQIPEVTDFWLVLVFKKKKKKKTWGKTLDKKKKKKKKKKANFLKNFHFIRTQSMRNKIIKHEIKKLQKEAAKKA
uniref:Large ribosomal subunit protein eL14 n=1 Tax=Latimeria chalumnae TaxID=7897 RepID=H3B787_LATCH